jgi:glycosyltransferase involved in cell wall biosynthesis
MALMRGGPLEDDLRSAGIDYRILGFDKLIQRNERGAVAVRKTLRGLGRLARLVGWLRREQINVLHAFLLWPSAICLPIGALAGVKVRISGRHNLGTDVAGRRYPILERITGLSSHYVVAVSHAVARAISAQGAPGAKIHVIYNAVDEVPAARGVDRQPPRGVMIANLIHYKGHRDLIEGLALLKDPPHIDCYGDGAERESLEDLARKRNLDGVIVFHGLVPEASRVYQDAQFALLTSHEEGLGIALLEAMAAGLPVVATAVGGVVELIRDSETGLLTPARDPASLARRIDQLASTPELRLTLGRNARREVLERFSWERCVAQHEQLYRDRGSEQRT